MAGITVLLLYPYATTCARQRCPWTMCSNTQSKLLHRRCILPKKCSKYLTKWTKRIFVAETIYRWCMTHITCIAAPDSSVPGSITHPTVYAPREPMKQLSILSRIMVAPAEAFMASAIMSGLFSCHLAIRRQAVVHTSDSQVNMQRQ